MNLVEKFYFLAQAMLIFLNVWLGTAALKESLGYSKTEEKICGAIVALFYFGLSTFFVLR